MTAASSCPTGKKVLPSVGSAKIAAHGSAREWNKQGRFAESLYTYRCPHCHQHHLTRDPDHDGVPNTLVFTAAPVELQLWAMPAHLADEARRSLDG